MRWRVHEAADEELLQAATWYESNERGLGEQLVDEYQSAVERILQAPTRFAKLETTRGKRMIHRCPVKRFPYYIGYESWAISSRFSLWPIQNGGRIIGFSGVSVLDIEQLPARLGWAIPASAAKLPA